MELQKILLDSLRCENTFKYLRELDEKNILEKIIPKVQDMKLVGECKYHVVNCYDHSLNALEEFENILKEEDFFPDHLKNIIDSYLNSNTEDGIRKSHLLKLGVFLHDIGKPDCKTVDETGRVHFKGHEIVGSDIAYELGHKLGLSPESVNILYKYVKYHMALLVFYKKNNLNQDELFELFDKLGDEIIGLMLLGYADIISTRKLLNPNENVGIIKTYVEFILTNYEYRYKRQ